MRVKKVNACDVYAYAKSRGVKAAADQYKYSTGRIEAFVEAIDSYVKVVKDKGLSSYSPRDLMEELAGRGYTGKLAYTQEIDITNF